MGESDWATATREFEEETTIGKSDIGQVPDALPIEVEGGYGARLVCFLVTVSADWAEKDGWDCCQDETRRAEWIPISSALASVDTKATRAVMKALVALHSQ